MATVTQLTFLQPLPQLLWWMDTYTFPDLGPGRGLDGEGDVFLGNNPLYASKNEQWGVAEGKQGVESLSKACPAVTPHLVLPTGERSP